MAPTRTIRAVEAEAAARGIGPTRDEAAQDALRILGFEGRRGWESFSRLPFGPGDVTAGSETELQASVGGQRDRVDLPLTVAESRYFTNMVRRAAAGEASHRAVTRLERYLEDNDDGVWDNSWVRFPEHLLRSYAAEVLETDFRSDRTNPESPQRSDLSRFFTLSSGETLLRLPLSYVVKLALADVISPEVGLPEPVRASGRRLLPHFLSDNTSPETSSFHVVPLPAGPHPGAALAREGAKRYLLTQLLVAYANQAFGLAASGQRAVLCLSPHPPIRQKALSELVSDSFYRELYMSPCLSGWDRGEEKHRYMELCHQVLTRSQLNAVGKLREAGIVANNLVVLPSPSNVSLANNGTHVSLGSRRLTALLSDPDSGFGPAHEKVLGDLVIKIAEHFLPLFVGTYSASPYRLGFSEFHPELALGFLPHELDFTHLRMLWRRWRGKAQLRFLGRTFTPFGPQWLDTTLSRTLRLRGDFVPDFRLVDYPVCLLSTDESPALDGTLGNADRLRRDLTELGVFDSQMSIYLLLRLREFRKMGFSGFEGRHYSVFPSLLEDFGRAADLQVLVTTFAFHLIARGEVDHASIPDDPSTESERRHVFFATALGVPTFFVKKDTGNRFLGRILSGARGLRPSGRYPGYLRVEIRQYRAALLRLLREDGAELLETMGMRDTVDDLARRVGEPAGHSASDRLTRGILEELGRAPYPRRALDVDAREFNLGAEKFYRETLRRRHQEEALGVFAEDLARLEQTAGERFGASLHGLTGAGRPSLFLESVGADLLEERLADPVLARVIGLLLLTIQHDAEEADRALRSPQAKEERNVAGNRPPVRRAGNG